MLCVWLAVSTVCAGRPNDRGSPTSQTLGNLLQTGGGQLEFAVDPDDVQAHNLQNMCRGKVGKDTVEEPFTLRAQPG